ncbi:DUF5694 domain-containing protein [Planomicrobium sp. CPCC 101110]|uniref:DUF5694 domain-containing protein n=1 Tax=Planomicrobium sp. CPCC 101110 TaxID=2599619 RepID=UPI0011B8B123|nr:DUF5694 domain-containing protein [Planomicrobium sp. CPCC 101110]TWT26036.1 hypothetical protein FQV30_09605 [Planomicrobium sp. CPCC 101110]
MLCVEVRAHRGTKLLIYKNIIELATSPNDRIIVLYGAGHLPLLIQFMQDSGLVNVEVAGNYLSHYVWKAEVYFLRNGSH